MSENRSLSVLEVLVHLTDTLPDKFVFGSAEIPDTISRETVSDTKLTPNWQTLNIAEQNETRRIGDEWVERSTSAILFVPSVVTGESNLLINPAHGDFALIKFFKPVPFAFDLRLLSRPQTTVIGKLI